MKTQVMLLILCLFISCGKKSSANSSDSNTDTINAGTALSVDEISLKEMLLSNRDIEQRELIKILVSFKKLGPKTLSRLDKHLNVHCSESSGLCSITNKE